MPKSNLDLSRRRLVLGALQGTGLVLLSGCQKFFNGLQQNKKFVSLLESAEDATQSVQRLLTGKHKLAKEFTPQDISRTFKANGNPPPITTDYAADAARQWASWRLEVGGLVKQPTRVSLREVSSLPSRSQITRHDCVEGWSAIAKWKGVPLAALLESVRPKPRARFVVFYCADPMAEDGTDLYYESIDLEDAFHPQTILAYEMNDAALPVANGAPIRLRVERQLGYKHAKYVMRMELVP